MLQSLFYGGSTGVDFKLLNKNEKKKVRDIAKRVVLNPYLNTPISQGTSKLQDLMPKFLDAAHEITKLLYLKGENEEVLDLREEWQDVVDNKNFGSTQAWLLSDELELLLNDLAPKGFYFGSHPDDGACFGFWDSD